MDDDVKDAIDSLKDDMSELKEQSASLQSSRQPDSGYHQGRRHRRPEG